MTQTRSIQSVPLDLNWVKRWYERPIHRRASTAPRGPKPLFVVDGRRMTADEFALIRLNPNEIVEVHILKEADARPLYGEAAAGGVVIITTKQAAGR
ncbi:MAG TPA: TonB-dependent receptor plug domain-containing protein [Longimicrobium sp.]|nr:TonB-dependent receptor plug domain-containing protein [Longimicrobium sp.]